MKQVGCNEVDKSMNEMEEFDYTVEQFADLQLLQIGRASCRERV